ncbi:hypothetical protein BBJ29_002957 [Phytophthora kernoviae]|uniref:Inositol oxygenase n=1 Tax=Phytophthora kernoviae TaxID=325452 RepID=A0A3F2RTX2_9STRA|nr:hypothetical protein BBJ29_002957 [Phytophthora kernoviae]RLN64151.1 hypothetical protein BBP00_00003627 [Phytophthora kernoviae]
MESLLPPLGACTSVMEALPASAARFRLTFTNDRRTKELRWVLFSSTQRGAVGKLIFTLEKNATAHVKSVVVNTEFRGLGLARVLYLATLNTLEEFQVRELHLEAEEDSKRHGRLVGLYQGVYGKFLCVEEDGTILADRPLNSTWETFQAVPHHAENAMQNAGGIALRSFHGSYLCIDPLEKRVEVSDYPVPWDGGEIMSLVCNKEDPRPLFVKIMRKYQTRAFVKKQVAKYGDLEHAEMSVAEACKCVMELTGETERADSWVIKYMLATADAVKKDGHPDWLQLAVFLRALGMLFLCWTDDDNAVLRSISTQEWMDRNTTWVVGMPIPSSIEFPELNELNLDHSGAAKGSESVVDKHCGLEHVMLPWTSDEYLYRVLSGNKTTLPTEAFDVVRLWSFNTWHQQNNYEELCAPQDIDTKEWVNSITKVASVGDDAVQQLVEQLEDELAGLKLAAGVWSTLPNFRNTVDPKLTTKALVAEKTSKAFEWEMIAGQQSILRQISEGEHAKLRTGVLHRIQQAKEAMNLTRHYGYDSLDMRPPLYNFGDFDELLAGMGEVYVVPFDLRQTEGVVWTLKTTAAGEPSAACAEPSPAMVGEETT